MAKRPSPVGQMTLEHLRALLEEDEDKSRSKGLLTLASAKGTDTATGNRGEDVAGNGNEDEMATEEAPEFTSRFPEMQQAFQADPLATVEAAGESGFFDGLQTFGAALMSMGGDMSGVKAVASDKARAAAAQLAQRKEARAARTAEDALTLKLMDDIAKAPDPDQRRDMALAAIAKVKDPTNAALLATSARDYAGARRLGAIRDVGKHAERLATVAQGMADAGIITMDELRAAAAELNTQQLLQSANKAGALSDENLMFMSTKENQQALAEALGVLPSAAVVEARGAAAKTDIGSAAEARAAGAKTAAQEAAKNRADPGDLVDALGNLKTSASNAVFREAAALFGGLYNPADGTFTALDAKAQVQAQQLAAEAAKVIRESAGARKPTSVSEAVQQAAKSMGVKAEGTGGAPGGTKEKPAQPRTKADYDALPSGAYYVHPDTKEVRRKR